MSDEDELRDSILQLSRDGRVSCEALLGLAQEKGVSPGRIGKLCDEMDIHIFNCQLGCFQ